MRTKTARTFRAVALTAALLATIQPVLGSFAFFGGAVDLDTVHLVVGGILYNLAIVLAVLAPFARFRRHWIVFGLSVLQYVLLHLQLQLGLGSNDDPGLLAYHIPVGVAIFFVAYLTVALALGLSLRSGEA